MKKQNPIQSLAMIALILSSAFLFNSCQKITLPNQTFDDVFNTSKIKALNDLVENSASVTDLPSELTQNELTIPEGLQDIQISELISLYEKNNALSDIEVDLLLKNDVATYLNVIDRISSMPSQLKDLNMNLDELKNSALNKYLLVEQQEPDQYYLDDYYHSVIELQKYMKTFVIQPLRDFENLVEKSATLKSANGNDKETIVLSATLTLELITSNNNWDMWWAYQKIGNKIIKTKHKGSAGSWPGNSN